MQQLLLLRPFPPYLDLLPDISDFKYNNDSVSNDGPELYMEEDESDDLDWRSMVTKS
jgi:hypothetical protein